MERKDIFEKLTVVFRQVMDNDCIVLDEYTSANDIDEWDSLTHVQLTEQIQEEFGIKFSAESGENKKHFASVDALAEYISAEKAKLN